MLPLKENALFMRYWRAQARPLRMLSIISFFVMVLMAVVFGCFLLSLYSIEMQANWAKVAFGILLGVQAVLLLGMGGYQAGAATSQENLSGALDFHRASSTPALDQVIGLLAGPTATTWILFALTIPAILLCLFFDTSIPLLAGLATIPAMALTGLFYQLLSGAFGISFRRFMPGGTQQASGLGVVLGISFFASIFVAGPIQLPGFLSSVPVALGAFDLSAAGREGVRIAAAAPMAFFGLQLPLLLTQFIVQMPLIVIAFLALRRAVKYPGRPSLSKPLALMLVSWLFFLFIAAGVAAMKTIPAWYGDGLEPEFAAVLLTVFAGFVVFVAVCVINSVTPRYNLFCGGLRRRHEGLPGKPVLADDAASNGAWLAAFGVISAIFYGILWLILRAKLDVSPLMWLSLGAALLYVGWLAQGVELARLRPEKQKSPIFLLALMSLWLVLPAVGFIAQINQVHSDEWLSWASYVMSACPIFGVAITGMIGAGEAADSEMPVSIPVVMFTVNAVLLVGVILLAYARRRKVSRHVLEAMSSKTPSAGRS